MRVTSLSGKMSFPKRLEFIFLGSLIPPLQLYVNGLRTCHEGSFNVYSIIMQHISLSNCYHASQLLLLV